MRQLVVSVLVTTCAAQALAQQVARVEAGGPVRVLDLPTVRLTAEDEVRPLEWLRESEENLFFVAQIEAKAPRLTRGSAFPARPDEGELHLVLSDVWFVEHPRTLHAQVEVHNRGASPARFDAARLLTAVSTGRGAPERELVSARGLDAEGHEIEPLTSLGPGRSARVVLTWKVSLGPVNTVLLLRHRDDHAWPMLLVPHPRGWVQ